MSKFTQSTRAMVILLVALFMSTSIVAADYIGPQRTYEIDVPSSCHITYSGSGAACGGYPSNPVSCTCNIYCDDCLRSDLSCSGVGEGQVEAQCGHKDFSETDREVVYKTVTRSYPIAVASTSWSCPIPGSNGWCYSPYPVQLNGVDLYASAGYYITALEGILDGVPFFADTVDTITIQIGEGTHHLDFWALSSYGDSSNHFVENYYVDTQDPVINASLSGTPGDNNWFVSDTTLTVSFTDPMPGSGVASTRVLSNSAEISVVNPYTFTEGVYFLQLDVTDFAGHGAQTLYNLMVDTTSPLVTANQPPVELVSEGIAGGGYVNGSVVFTGTCSDATSGVNRIEISTGGGPLTSIAPNPDGSWTLDWDSSMLPDGTYTPVITAVDTAGNRTDFTMGPITLDNSAPAMSITGGWYIWESGHIEVFDSRAGIKHIELSVRDDQGRWPAREWSFDTPRLEMDLQWDRKFGDGTIAPTGSYEVLLQAWDKLDNGRWIAARIYIPEAGATAVIPYAGMITVGNIEPTNTPMPTQPVGEPLVSAVGGSEPQPTNTPVPTSTMIAIPISGGEDNTVILSSSDNSGDNAPANTVPISDGILWGAAALAAGAAAAVVSARQLKETRAKEEAKIWEEAIDAIKKRWEQTVARYEAWNKAAEKAQAAHEKAVQAEKAEWLAIIAQTGGHTITDLSEEQFQDFIGQSEGAYLAAKEYIEQQQNAYEAAQKKAELDRQSAAAKAAIAGFIASQERNKEENEAKEYSNQRKSFNEKEQEDNWKRQQENLKAFHEKEANAQKEIDAYKEQQWKETFDGFVVPDYMKNAYLGNSYDGKSVFTPDEDLQKVIDNNIAKQVEEGTVNKWVANVLNSASAGLGVLHDTIDPPIKKIFGSDAAQSVNDFLTGFGQEIMLCELWPAFIASPSAAEYVESIIPETRAAYLGRIFGNIAVGIISAIEINSAIFGGGAAVLVTEVGTAGVGTPVAVLEIEGIIVVVAHGVGSIVASGSRLGENIRAFSEADSGRSSSNNGNEQALGGNSSTQSGNNPAIKTVTLDDLPQNASEMYKKYDQHGWQGNVSGQTPGTAAGRKYFNDDNRLPSIDSAGNPITYQEFDVNNKLPNATRDSERFVRGSDGSVYYTDTHYQSTFLQILGGE